MNERIRELAKQAGAHFSTQTLTSNPVQYRESIGLWDKNIEKFAELLVQECILTIQMGITRDGTKTEKFIRSMTHIKDIKEHFGVEE